MSWAITNVAVGFVVYQCVCFEAFIRFKSGRYLYLCFIRHVLFPSVLYSVIGVLIGPYDFQFGRQLNVTILFIFCQTQTNNIIINAPYSTPSQWVSVCAACVEHDSRHIAYLNACVDTHTHTHAHTHTHNAIESYYIYAHYDLINDLGLSLCHIP